MWPWGINSQGEDGSKEKPWQQGEFLWVCQKWHSKGNLALEKRENKPKQNREGTCIKRRRTKPKGKEEWVYLRTDYDARTDRGGGDDNEENTFKVLTSEPVTLTINRHTLKTKTPPLSSLPGCFPNSITCWYNHFPCRPWAAEHGWACRTSLSLLGNAFLPPEFIAHSFLLTQHYTPLL